MMPATRREARLRAEVAGIHVLIHPCRNGIDGLAKASGSAAAVRTIRCGDDDGMIASVARSGTRPKAWPSRHRGSAQPVHPLLDRDPEKCSAVLAHGKRERRPLQPDGGAG